MQGFGDKVIVAVFDSVLTVSVSVSVWPRGTANDEGVAEMLKSVPFTTTCVPIWANVAG